ncbi:pyridoxamine 5'-phosphate oxidase family protein [Rapidithrix thailandica]|uniref:Pyridoxamine 5'-phosphate oxidase family protein n=1 Tax=Rapidithrix thailandica TaxID=413964 RepID=A0AAW9S7S7_9BACT
MQAAQIIQDFWDSLKDSLKEFQNPLHLPVFGTISSRQVPSLRKVVLREVNIEKRFLVFYSDYRTSKIQELKVAPRVCWLFYEPEKERQYRVYGDTKVYHTNEVACKYWKKLSYQDQKEYHLRSTPGTTYPKDKLEIETDSQEAYQNFCVVITQIDEVDYLELGVEEHFRYLCTYQQQEWVGKRLVP